MISTFDEDKKTFVPLISLSEEKKKQIANAIHEDVMALLKKFNEIKISRFRWKGNDEKQQNQDMLDSVLSSCLPLMWHYVNDFPQRYEEDPELLQFVPEGFPDAATLELEKGLKIKIWKEGSKEPKLNWMLMSPW